MSSSLNWSDYSDIYLPPSISISLLLSSSSFTKHWKQKKLPTSKETCCPKTVKSIQHIAPLSTTVSHSNYFTTFAHFHHMKIPHFKRKFFMFPLENYIDRHEFIKVQVRNVVCFLSIFFFLLLSVIIVIIIWSEQYLLVLNRMIIITTKYWIDFEQCGAMHLHVWELCCPKS